MKNFLILVVTTLLVSSCLKDEDIKFELQNGASYVLQEDGVDGDFIYSPFIYVYSSTTTHQLSNVTIQNETQSISTKKLSDWEWVTTGSYPSVTSMNGKYTLIATNQNDETIETPLEIAMDEKDIVGEIKVDSFEYVNNKIKAKVFIPKNAVAVGFSINYAGKESAFDRYTNTFYYIAYEYTSTIKDGKTGQEKTVTTTLEDQATEDGAVRISLAFDTDSDLDMIYANKVQIGIVASSRHGVHRVGPTRILTKGAQTF